MIYKIQVVTIGEDGCQETLEIACVERTDLKPETLGLPLYCSSQTTNSCSSSVIRFLPLPDGLHQLHLPAFL
jgi:hypothetical protein